MVNTKYRVLNALDETPEERTYVVIGLGRSGTSFVASVLNYLGCFMGDSAGQGTLEDLKLSKAMEEKDDARLGEIIEDYNAQNDVWAFKRPSSILHIDRIEPMSRNPHYIFIHRDFFSIALRNEVSIGRDISDSLQRCLKHSASIYEFMNKTSRPSLHLSFELTLTDRREAAEIIRDFVFPEKSGDHLDEKTFEAAMSKQHKAYLGNS